MATNSIPFGPRAEKGLRSPATEYKPSERTVVCNWRECRVVGITRHIIRSSLTLCCETHQDKVSEPAMNPGLHPEITHTSL